MGSEMGRRARQKEGLDVELADLPPELRWREWMGRVEAVIFASPEPVTREVLARAELGAGEVDGQSVAVPGRPVDVRPTGEGQAEHARDLVEGLPRRIVDGGAERPHIGGDVGHEQEAGVAT